MPQRSILPLCLEFVALISNLFAKFKNARQGRDPEGR